MCDFKLSKEQIPGRETRDQAFCLHGISAIAAAQGNLSQCNPGPVQDIYLEVLDYDFFLKLGLECQLDHVSQRFGPQKSMIDGHTPYHDDKENHYGYKNLFCARLHLRFPLLMQLKAKPHNILKPLAVQRLVLVFDLIKLAFWRKEYKEVILVCQ